MSKKDKGYPWKAKPGPVVREPVGPEPLATAVLGLSNPPQEPTPVQTGAVITEVLPAGEPFLALGVVKVGAHWHKVEIDCELVNGKARVVETRLGNAAVRAQAVAEFKQTAVRKKVTA